MSALARSKLLLARYGLIFALVFLLISFGAFGLAWSAYGEPSTETVTEQINQEEYEFAGQHEALVNTTETGLYEPHTTLADMPAYFFNETPELTVRVNGSLPESETVDVDQTLLLRHEAARNEEVFWEQEELLATDATTVSTGDTQLSATIDMERVRAFVNRHQERIGGVGTIETSLMTTMEYESDRYAGTLQADSGLTFSSTAYWLEDELGASTTESESESETIMLDPDFGEIWLFGGLGLVFLALAIGTSAVAHRGVDTERIETELARAEYSEWISNGEIPTKSEKEYVKVESLEDVVDIAIDTNKRVIFDAHLDAYGVIDGDLVYYYSPDADEIEHWLDV